MKNKISKKMMLWISLLFSFAILSASCDFNATTERNKLSEDQKLQHVDWSKNSNIYEVNIRQYTPEGTIKAFSEHLPRLKNLGVDILWIMPIQPIGEKNRKGTLGSYYAVKDYTALNSEFGTMADFKELVNKVHELGMHIILDWVANHSAWDNEWVFEHPEWYKTDSSGNIISPVEDWADVAGLNFENSELRSTMISALKFWVEETDIDGYRCDVAGMVPTEFWETARSELLKIKHIFMLAEANLPEHHDLAFDMSYAWDMHFLLNDIAEGKRTLADLNTMLETKNEKFPANAYRMNFTSNHDENSWKGNVYKRMGDAVKPMAVFTITSSGMPLIYSGQEACLNKDLRFFDKDTISWESCEMEAFYTTLLHLKKENEALWNGEFGGKMLRILTTADDKIFAYTRKKGKSEVITILNLSEEEVDFEFSGLTTDETLTEVFTSEQFENNDKYKMEAWAFKVYATK